MKKWAVAICLVAGCSSSLPFNFQFADSDGSTGGNDLSAPLPDLHVNDDLAMTMNDLAMTMNDLASVDQRSTQPDLAAADLQSVDLKATDMVIVDAATPADMTALGHLGAPCGPCLVGLTCFKDVAIGDAGTLTFPKGYCSKLCDVANLTACTAFGGTCVPISPGSNASACVAPCDSTCVARYADQYACCSRVTSTATKEGGCLPANVGNNFMCTAN